MPFEETAQALFGGWSARSVNLSSAEPFPPREINICIGQQTVTEGSF